MAEWPIAPVLKTGVLQGTGGSNPSSSETKIADLKSAILLSEENKPKVWLMRGIRLENITDACSSTEASEVKIALCDRATFSCVDGLIIVIKENIKC